MTIGRVTAQKEAVIDLQVYGPTGQTLQIEVVIDTGFNGYLTLSTDMVDTLNLQFVCTTPAALGDGHQVYMDVYEADVLWDEEKRKVVVLATDAGALLGMSMLMGHRMTLDIEEEGPVTIETLSPKTT